MAVIAVNYRGSHDTLECLASLFVGDTIPYVIVADNASNDGSVGRIATWAEGRARTPIADPDHANPNYEHIAKPIDYEVLQADQLTGGVRKPLTIIETGGNLGFAGGNNRGLELASANPDIDIFWLLNNDTIVKPDTVRKLRDAFSKNQQWGMVGTPIRLYHDARRNQLLNGMRFNKWTASAAGIAGGSSINVPFDRDAVIAETGFVCGASLAVTREFFNDVGYLEEEFFLYYEEIDWALRAKRRHQIGFAEDAIVYHKEGASAGSASKLSTRARSPLSEYHHIRSKMIFGRKHFPLLWPVYFAQNLVILTRRLLRRQTAQAAAVARATFGLPFKKS